MLKHKHIPALGLLATLQIFASTSAWAGASYNQAIADYTAGKYGQALAEFKQYVNAYPTNAQTHYYLGLCYQAMGSRAEAREEFILTSKYSNGTLSTYAQQALQALGGASTASSTRSSTVVGIGPAASSPSAPQTASAGGAVAQVFDFYTDW